MNEDVEKKRLAVSLLFDGEIDDIAVRPALMTAVSGLRNTAESDWQLYALIGDRLRGEPAMSADFVTHVMSDIAHRPVVLAPGRAHAKIAPHPFLALAASVAGVAWVGWFALSGSSNLSQIHAWPAMTQGAVSPAPTFVAQREGGATRLRSPAKLPSMVSENPLRAPTDTDIGDYLLAHHAHAGAFDLGGGAQQVRTVSLNGPGSRP